MILLLSHREGLSLVESFHHHKNENITLSPIAVYRQFRTVPTTAIIQMSNQVIIYGFKTWISKHEFKVSFLKQTCLPRYSALSIYSRNFPTPIIVPTPHNCNTNHTKHFTIQFHLSVRGFQTSEISQNNTSNPNHNDFRAWISLRFDLVIFIRMNWNNCTLFMWDHNSLYIILTNDYLPKLFTVGLVHRLVVYCEL